MEQKKRLADIEVGAQQNDITLFKKMLKCQMTGSAHVPGTALALWPEPPSCGEVRCELCNGIARLSKCEMCNVKFIE